MTSVSERQAVDDVVADLVDHFGADADEAERAVVAFAGKHPFMGYGTLASAVHENTSYVVAEWMKDEGMVAVRS